MADSNPEARLCAMCVKDATNTCTGCHDISYCSKECQKSDWSIHKLLCKSFKDFQENWDSQDGPSYKRAIYFPFNEDRPRFVWVRVILGDDAKATIDTSDLLGNDYDLIDGMEVESNALLNRPLVPHFISIFGKFTRLSYFSGHKLNHLRNNLLPTEGELNMSFRAVDENVAAGLRGPIIAVGRKDATNWSDQIHDLGLLDFRHIVDMLMGMHFNRQRYLMGQFDGDKVKGLIMNCQGDHLISGGTCHRGFENIDVPKSMCESTSEVKIELADAIGIPLVVQKLAPSLAWRDRKFIVGAPNLYNLGAAILMGHVNDPNALLNTSVPANGQGIQLATEYGTWKVVRKDGLPLERTLIIGMWEYGMAKYFESMFIGRPFYSLASKEEFERVHADFTSRPLPERYR